MLRDDIGRIARRALEAVGIGNHLIAFYPREIHRSQAFVILLDPASGILKRHDLQAAK
jgi:hypothetical protein